MRPKLLVENLSSSELEVAGNVAVYCIGCEKRSRFLVESLNMTDTAVLAVWYSTSRIHSFEENLTYAFERSFNVISVVDGVAEGALTSASPGTSPGPSPS